MDWIQRQKGRILSAFVDSVTASRLERAPFGKLIESRRLPPNGVEARTAGVRHRLKEGERVGMAGATQDLLGWAFLNHSAGVKDRDPIADRGDHPDVVGDEQDRKTDLALKILDEPEDLGLKGDVKRRRRLVGDQHLGATGKRDREHDALALTTA